MISKKFPGPSNPELKNILMAKVGINLFHQNIRGLFSKKRLIKEFFEQIQGYWHWVRDTLIQQKVMICIKSTVFYSKTNQETQVRGRRFWLEDTPKVRKAFWFVISIVHQTVLSSFQRILRKKLLNILSKISNLSRM